MDYVPKGGKFKLKPKRYHGYSVLLFILGTLFPPLAVAARFGIGKDFWINLVLTICGYFPGHGHNFYIQNIRNNKNRARTPKWAARYGLVDTTTMDRKKKRSDWAKRYNERTPGSALDAQDYEEGQVPDQIVAPEREPHDARSSGPGLWQENEEQYYNAGNSRRPTSDSVASLHSENSGGRWSYPANFDDAVVEGSSRRKKKSSKKDRWARTEEVYSMPDDSSVPRRKKKKKKKSRTGEGEPDGIPSEYYSQGDTLDAGYDPKPDSRHSFGANVEQVRQAGGAGQNESAQDEFDHQF